MKEPFEPAPPPRFCEIRRHELIARLERGDAGGVCVLTPNQRLSGALGAAFAQAQAARGLASWESPDILPWGAFVARLYQDALYSELGERMPLLLSPLQEQAIWETVVAGSESGSTLLSVASAATLARDAWMLAHAWRLLPSLRDFFGNDDTRVFADWAWRYEGITSRDRQIERARLPEWLSPRLQSAALRKPALLVAYGFDIFTPQQQVFLDALAGADVEILRGMPDAQAAAVRRVACRTAKDEHRLAAQWARSRLERAAPAGERQCRIGIVVPDLERSRDAIRRAFTQVMAPAQGFPGTTPAILPFNISLGMPLPGYPLARAALLILDLAGGEIEFAAASRLLRSPFIAAGTSEAAARACLDAALRRQCAPRTTLERLRRAIARNTAPDNAYRVRACPQLAHGLGALAQYARENLSGSRRPGVWARTMLGLLETLGFPGERALDSIEYQTLQKLHETIAAFAALDRVAGRMRFTQARARLARALGETLFQPEAATVPVHILGVLESAGMQFDHLWVMGLAEESWPMPPRPNPFIPVALQKRAGVPEASGAASLDLDRRITRGWLGAALEVVISHPLREDDRELPASPLIRAIDPSAVEDLALPAHVSAQAAIHAAAALERIEDGRAPALPEGSTSAGGTGVFRDQAACPFRAFAIHRLGARGLDAVSAFNASDRGTLVHALLAKVWKELKSSAALAAVSPRDLQSLVEAAADVAINSLRSHRPEALAGRLGQLERARLVRLAFEWLALEKQRPPFEIAALESRQAISLGGLTVNARLDRMDRLLEASQGGWVVLDYKTGSAAPGGWLGERPDDPQLPLYAVGAAPSAGARSGVVALAFAQVRTGHMEFRGIGSASDLLPGVVSINEQRAQAARLYENWNEVLQGFRHELESIAREFVAGEARVAPKHDVPTCRYCELHALCRISEREGFAAAAEDGIESPGAQAHE